MAELKIETARFGEVIVDSDRVIEFIEPVLGFQNSSRYVLLDHADNSPFKWLQSVDEADLAFVVTNPSLFGFTYEFELPDETVAKLDIKAAEDALALTIVNIPQGDPGKMTANLLGPLIINQNLCRAMQVVLNDSQYSTKTRLISDETLQKQTEEPSSAHTADQGR